MRVTYGTKGHHLPWKPPSASSSSAASSAAAGLSGVLSPSVAAAKLGNFLGLSSAPTSSPSPSHSDTRGDSGEAVGAAAAVRGDNQLNRRYHYISDVVRAGRMRKRRLVAAGAKVTSRGTRAINDRVAETQLFR